MGVLKGALNLKTMMMTLMTIILEGALNLRISRMMTLMTVIDDDDYDLIDDLIDDDADCSY